MKKVLIIFFIIILSQYTAFSKEELIWDYDKENFLKNVIEGKADFCNLVTQHKMDLELSNLLDITLVYTNLKDCLQIAVDNNFAIKRDGSVREENLWEFQNSKAQFLPDYSYAYSIQNLSGTYLVGGIVTDNVNEIPIQNTFLLSWTITQGKPFFGYAQRKNKLKSATLKYNFTREEVIRDTAILYYELLGLKLNLEVLKSNLVDRHEQYKFTKARYDAGIGTKFDVVRAIAEEANAKQIYISALNDLRLKQARLANVMGIEVLNAIYPGENCISTRKLISEKEDIEKLYNIALGCRKDVTAQKYEIEALKAERSAKYSDFGPQVNVIVQNAIVGTKRLGLYPNTTVGLLVTVPIGDKLGLGTYTKIRAYNSRIEAEQFKLIELTRSVKEKIISSFYNSKTALERIEAAEKEVKSTEESLKISLVRLAVGESTFIDVIQAQAVKVQAKQKLIQATIDYNKAQVQLLFDAGIISVNTVLKDYEIPSAP